MIELNLLERINNTLSDHSIFVNLLNRFYAQKFRHLFEWSTSDIESQSELKSQKKINWLSHIWAHDTEAQVEKSLKILIGIHDLLKLNGIKLILSPMAIRGNFDGTLSTRPFDYLKKFALKNNILYIDTFGYLKEKIPALSAKDFFVDDVHFNELGNILYAEAQVEFIKSFLKNEYSFE